MDAREYAAKYRLRDFCRHVRAWAFDRTLVVKPIFEALASMLGDDDEGGEPDETWDPEGAEASQEPAGEARALPARVRPRVRKRPRNLPPGAIDLDGPIGPISRVVLDAENMNAFRSWTAKHGEQSIVIPPPGQRTSVAYSDVVRTFPGAPK